MASAHLALTPAIRRLEQVSPGAAQLVTALTQAFNGGLNGVLTQLSAIPDINIRRLDAYALLNGIVANPETYDLNNVTDACVTSNIVPFSCDRPDEYLFWDGIHPTRTGHAIVASAAALLLGQ